MPIKALPPPERPAGNAGHLDHARQRFDGDDPPPYESLADEEYDQLVVRPELLNSSSLPSEITNIVDPRLDDDELMRLSMKQP